MIFKGRIINWIFDQMYAIEISLACGNKTTVYKHHDFIHPNINKLFSNLKTYVKYAEENNKPIEQVFNEHRLFINDR
jgi:hypothetical protein